MSKVLSRNTNAGSVGLVTSGGSTTTYGTNAASADPILWLRAAEVNLQETVSSVVVDDLSGSGSGVEGARLVVSQEVAGTIRVPVTHEGMGGVLAWCLGGSTSTSGSGPYTHVYPTGINAPFRTLVHVFTAADGTSLQSEYGGLQVESLTLSVDAGGVAYATLSVRGYVVSRSGAYQLTVAATETPAADSVATTKPVLGRTGSVLSFGGNSVACRALTLTFTRPLDRAVDFGAEYLAEGVLSGAISVTMEVTRAADEEDTSTLQAALMAGTAGDTSISFTNGTRVFYVELSDAVPTVRSGGFSSGGALVETVTFTAQALTTGDYGFRVRVTNAASSAVTTNGTWA